MRQVVSTEFAATLDENTCRLCLRKLQRLKQLINANRPLETSRTPSMEPPQEIFHFPILLASSCQRARHRPSAQSDEEARQDLRSPHFQEGHRETDALSLVYLVKAHTGRLARPFPERTRSVRYALRARYETELPLLDANETLGSGSRPVPHGAARLRDIGSRGRSELSGISPVECLDDAAQFREHIVFIDHTLQQGLLAWKIVKDQAYGHLGSLRNRFSRARTEAMGSEQTLCRTENAFTRLPMPLLILFLRCSLLGEQAGNPLELQ